MKRFLKVMILVVGVGTLIGCNQQSSDLEEYNKVIVGYLDALENKDLSKMSEYATDKYIENFNGEVLEELKENLISLELKESELREDNTGNTIIDSTVEVVCDEDFIPVGDWQPGTTNSSKSFELIEVDGEIKINGWGTY